MERSRGGVWRGGFRESRVESRVESYCPDLRQLLGDPISRGKAFQLELGVGVGVGRRVRGREGCG